MECSQEDVEVTGGVVVDRLVAAKSLLVCSPTPRELGEEREKGGRRWRGVGLGTNSKKPQIGNVSGHSLGVVEVVCCCIVVGVVSVAVVVLRPCVASVQYIVARPKRPVPPMRYSLHSPSLSFLLTSRTTLCQGREEVCLNQKAGNIIRADIIQEPDGSGRSKGQGTVLFETPYEAQKAMRAFDGTDFQGRLISVHPVHTFPFFLSPFLFPFLFPPFPSTPNTHVCCRTSSPFDFVFLLFQQTTQTCGMNSIAPCWTWTNCLLVLM